VEAGADEVEAGADAADTAEGRAPVKRTVSPARSRANGGVSGLNIDTSV
jgi:hypothetical protein